MIHVHILCRFRGIGRLDLWFLNIRKQRLTPSASTSLVDQHQNQREVGEGASKTKRELHIWHLRWEKRSSCYKQRWARQGFIVQASRSVMFNDFAQILGHMRRAGALHYLHVSRPTCELLVACLPQQHDRFSASCHVNNRAPCCHFLPDRYDHTCSIVRVNQMSAVVHDDAEEREAGLACGGTFRNTG